MPRPAVGAAPLGVLARAASLWIASVFLALTALSAPVAAETAAGSATPPPAAAQAPFRLIMFEQSGCYWCERWHEEIAPIYPKTDEGQAAPLERRDIFDPMPDDVALARRPAFTPTFVLVQDGVEIGRIEGYPGEDFFWPMLARLIDRADGQPAAAQTDKTPSGT